VKKLYIVEEMDPYIENHLKMAGIPCTGKDLIPKFGELNPDIVRGALLGTKPKTLDVDNKVSIRPPVLCAGCPHRGPFYVLSKKKKVIVTGDIGCYTLSASPPLSAMHTCFCMGGSISAGHGAATVLRNAKSDLRIVAAIGDSTFFHTGINSLMDVIYNRGNTITLILDNFTTAMTGHQDNPGTGLTLMGEPAPVVDIPALCISLGIKKENIATVNPLNLKETEAAFDTALAKDEPSVIITKYPCILKRFTEKEIKEYDLAPKGCAIDLEKCKKCNGCIKTGCPAIIVGEALRINPDACTGCGICRQACKFDAITEVKK